MSQQQHEIELSNGLKIVGETNSLNKSCALGFFVNTGARDEVSIESGVSHFLEHMMFKGTAHRDAMEITYELGNMGAQANAYTSDENTVYYAAVIPQYFSALHELLSDMLRPSLEPSEFDTEKKVILEEIALYQDRPSYYLFENALRDFYGSHNAGHSVLGSTESVSGISRELMQAYFDRRYAPNNITLVATGNYDWQSFVEESEKHCGNWETHTLERTFEPFQSQSKFVEFRKENITQAHVMLMADGVSADRAERYDLSVLSVILGDSTGSKLYWELVDPGIADSAGCENDAKHGIGSFMMYASCLPEKVGRVSDALRKTLEQYKDFTDEDVTRAKNKLLSRIVLEGEMPLGRLMALGLEWNYRKEIHTLQNTISDLEKVTRESILDTLERFPFGEIAEYRLLPEAA